MQGSALRVPQFSDLTVRITGGAAPTAVSYQADGDAAAVEIPVEDAKSEADGKASAPKDVSGEPAAAPSEQNGDGARKGHDAPRQDHPGRHADGRHRALALCRDPGCRAGDRL